ncbi:MULTISPECIES: rhomboid family intramembrane serine protease [unclassified Paenibacillus]|uniref:rhomboid family intramembrane serine protease n=1 Tax=unclassified Paenibacillus TaxID=185978 RepID=UPI000838C007|nr:MULTISPECIES: rhomboid family intramembrane serine protease [unclassified Paenibacillus]NWL89417.1 rhomboid family intramembrane serine protease [Paenibacillus sp. 79R4]
MIFIRYEDWRSYLRYYPVTSLLLAANIVMFIIEVFTGGSTDNMNLLRLGAVTEHPQLSSEWWRLFAAMFLHAGVMHLVSNCFALLVFAPPLERLMGHIKYFVLYIFSGVIGNIITLAVYQSQHSLQYHVAVGASGAIYGIYGAFLFIALLQRNLMDENSRKTLYSLLMIGVVYSFVVTQINWIAHFGGLLGGFVLYAILSRFIKNH